MLAGDLQRSALHTAAEKREACEKGLKRLDMVESSLKHVETRPKLLQKPTEELENLGQIGRRSMFQEVFGRL